MAVSIRAHFDGTNIVPDEPVDWPAGTCVDAVLTIIDSQPERSAEREVAWEHLLSLRIPGIKIPEEALRRENMYEDRI